MALSCCKKLPALLRGIISNNNGNFIVSIGFILLKRKNVLKKHENVCKDHDYCHVERPDKDNNILKYNSREKKHESSI